MSADLLVAGAGGQVGREAARLAAAAGMQVAAFDRAALDVTDADAVARAMEAAAPKVVVNAAAYTAVDAAEDDADAAFAINRDGAANIASAANAVGAQVIHLSTDYVFDGRKAGTYVEDDVTAPLGVYGASKLAGEEAVAARAPRHVILRTSWVYGVQGRNFVRTMLRLGAERDALRVVDDQTGCPTYAADLAEAIVILAARLEKGGAGPDGYGVFHCAGAGVTTWRRFAERIFHLSAPMTGRSPRVEPIRTADYPTPAARPANSALDCGRLARVHGIALRPWPEALADMLAAELATSG